ncbi:hypothetical protein BGZ54_002532, partial [Gamsiella multidivaricata]
DTMTPMIPVPAAKKVIPFPNISTSPPGSAAMDNATMGHPTASPSSSSSSVTFSSSAASSPSSSTLSLPPPAVSSDKGKGKGKGKATASAYEEDDCCYEESSGNNGSRGRALFCTGLQTNQNADNVCATQSSDALLPMNNNSNNSITHQQSQPQPQQQKGGEHLQYPHKPHTEDHDHPPSAGISRPTTVSALTGKGKASRAMTSYPGTMVYDPSEGSGSGSSRSRFASAAAQSSYLTDLDNGDAGGSSSGSGSGSGSSSKPVLSRAMTGPASMQRPFLTSATSSSAIPPLPSYSSSTPEEKKLSDQDLALLSYDAIPADFDFGDLPFYDTDPRTGHIYGDPHAITRPHLIPEKHFDLYRFNYDESDPRRTNIFNKHNALLYYHPGRHIGQEQDSLRANTNNQPLWNMVGRTSTWGTLTATEMLTKRQIKIVMENNKKKATAESSSEPISRFVFRWKADDFVVEYRKHKDQYRITCFQMCGGESKWKPPQPKPTQTMFHGMGMDTPGNVHIPITVGSPSPFDPTRYLQLISEYRLNSGPVQKRGVFELYNPDTFPAEFRSFLMLVSLVILDVVRPFDDKQFYREFPDAALKKLAVSGTGGLHTAGGPVLNGRPALMAVVGQLGSMSGSSLAMDQSNVSSASMKANAVAMVDVGPTTIPTVKSTTRSRSMTLPAIVAAPTRTQTAPAVPSVMASKEKNTKMSRWGSFFKK